MPLKLTDRCRIRRGNHVSGTNFHSFLFCQEGSRFPMVHYTDMTKIHNLGISGPDAHELLVNHTRDLDRGDPYVGPTLANLIHHTTPITASEAIKLIDALPRKNRAYYVWNRIRDTKAKCGAYRCIYRALKDACPGSGPSSTEEYTPPNTDTSSSTPTTPGQSPGSDHKATPTRPQSTNPSHPAAAGSDGNYGGNDTSSRRHGNVRNAIYIPPWPTRVYGRLCSNEVSGRQEGNPPSIDTQSRATLPGCTSVTEGQGNGGVDEIKGRGKNVVDEADVQDNTSSYGYHVSEVGHSAIGSNMPAADNSDVASTSRVYSAINAAALAQLDMKKLPMEENMVAWLAGVDPKASPMDELDGDTRRRRCRKRKAEVESGMGKRRKC